MNVKKSYRAKLAKRLINDKKNNKGKESYLYVFFSLCLCQQLNSVNLFMCTIASIMNSPQSIVPFHMHQPIVNRINQLFCHRFKDSTKEQKRNNFQLPYTVGLLYSNNLVPCLAAQFLKQLSINNEKTVIKIFEKTKGCAI